MPRDVQRSQFGDPALTPAEALAACGPAAALAFARVNGRNPTLREAVDLAKSVGWTEGAGMAGPASQQALLAKMGVQADLTPTADWGRVTADVRAGKPVTISTPRHYYTVSDADEAGRYYVGASGTDVKGGSAWMTADEIAGQGGGVNGVLHLAGAPAGPSPTLADPHRSAVEAAFGDLGPGAVENMLAIMAKESSGNPTARKNDAIEDSQGLFQINTRAHPDLARKYDLSDPAQNARAAREVYDQQGYGAWHTASTQLGLLGAAPTSPVGLPRERQVFLEANDPGGPGVPASPGRPPSATSGAPPTPVAENTPQTTPTASAETGLPDWMTTLQAQDAYRRHIMAQFPEAPTLGGFQLPGVPALPGFRPTRPSRYRLPGGL